MTTRHVLKSWEPYFSHTLDGRKAFDLRRDDRGYQVGDTVELVEVERRDGLPPTTTGRTLVRRIVYILGRERPGSADAHAFGLEPGFVVLGLGP